MISRKTFDEVKREFGWCASWAVWSKHGERPKEGIGDTSVLDPDLNRSLLSEIHSDFWAVGLNVSRNVDGEPFSNFHSKNSRATDYKIRYAFQGTPLWGSYMTDILKDFPEVDSSKVAASLRRDPDQLVPHQETFLREIALLGSSSPTIFAFGKIALEILESIPDLPAKLVGITHYAHFISPENYRKHVHSTLEKVL